MDRIQDRSLRPRRGQRVLQDEDDGVSAEEHLGDEAVLVDWLGFLLAYHENMGLDFKPIINYFSLLGRLDLSTLQSSVISLGWSAVSK